ncbi:uncharacterized protein LOC135498907 [Lineus longissimus]|uniref:uncharacterized protein LOC135498907 n=1 Tax=Lineus longissimus TaxID=88925 RepID=UPI00315DFD26
MRAYSTTACILIVVSSRRFATLSMTATIFKLGTLHISITGPEFVEILVPSLLQCCFKCSAERCLTLNYLYLENICQISSMNVRALEVVPDASGRSYLQCPDSVKQQSFSYHLHHVIALNFSVPVYEIFYHKENDVVIVTSLLEARTIVNVFKIDPMKGELRQVGSQKSFNPQARVIGEYEQFLIVTPVAGSGLFVFLGLDCRYKGRISFKNIEQSFVDQCRRVQIVFDNTQSRRIQMLLVAYHDGEYMKLNCLSFEMRSKSGFTLVSQCQYGGPSVKFLTSSYAGSFALLKKSLSRSSIFNVFDAKTRDVLKVKLSIANVTDVKFLCINEVYQIFLIGIARNRIILLKWQELKQKSFYRIKQEDIIKFGGNGQYIILNSGELVLFETSVAQPSGQRNLTQLRIYLSGTGCW